MRGSEEEVKSRRHQKHNKKIRAQKKSAFLSDSANIRNRTLEKKISWANRRDYDMDMGRTLKQLLRDVLGVAFEKSGCSLGSLVSGRPMKTKCANVKGGRIKSNGL